MKFTDVRTLESFLKEYGMNSGASTYGSNQSSITAPATGSKSPSKSPDVLIMLSKPKVKEIDLKFLVSMLLSKTKLVLSSASIK